MTATADTWAEWNAEIASRAEAMPDTDAALRQALTARLRLRDLGWQDGIYCPKDGTVFEAIEWGSTGIFRAHYHGEWPDGILWIHDAGDLWPNRPHGILWRPIEEGQ